MPPKLGKKVVLLKLSEKKRPDWKLLLFIYRDVSLNKLFITEIQQNTQPKYFKQRHNNKNTT